MSARLAIHMSPDASCCVEPPVPRTPATRLIGGSPRIRSTSAAGVVLRAGVKWLLPLVRSAAVAAALWTACRRGRVDVDWVCFLDGMGTAASYRDQMPHAPWRADDEPSRGDGEPEPPPPPPPPPLGRRAQTPSSDAREQRASFHAGSSRTSGARAAWIVVANFAGKWAPQTAASLLLGTRPRLLGRPLLVWAVALGLVQASPGDVVYRCLRLDGRTRALAVAVSALYKHQRLVALVDAGAAARRACARTLVCSLVQVHGSWACSAIENYCGHRGLPPPQQSGAARSRARLCAADLGAGLRKLWDRASLIGACTLAMALVPPRLARAQRALRCVSLLLFALQCGVMEAAARLREESAREKLE